MVAVAKCLEHPFLDLGGLLAPPEYFPPADCRALREVGRGGMAVVYEACDQSHERLALKVSLPTLPHSELVRFRQEATIGHRLQHPGVPRIHGHGHFDGGVWITMEFVDGTSLEDRLDDPSFSAAERLSVLDSVADTLQHAHERGVVHRDVKPSNIVLGPDHPKLLDFGIAKITNVAMTNSERMVGTPTHMAPEQLFGDEIDHRADIFQLGVLTYELFATGRPWEGEHPVRLAWAVCYEEPASLSDHVQPDLRLPREVLDPLEQLVRSSLSREPDDRPATAAEFRGRIQALRRAIGSDTDVRFGAPVWNIADSLILLGRSSLSTFLPPSRQLLLARTADEALGHLLAEPRRRLIIDCDAVGHESVLDILDVIGSWRQDEAITLLCNDPEWHGVYALRGVRVIPQHAVGEIYDDLLAV